MDVLRTVIFQAGGDECPNCDPEPEDPKEEFRNIGDRICRVVTVYGGNGIDPTVHDPILNVIELDPQQCYIFEAEGSFFRFTFTYYGS